jgi:hypothetical protein
LGLFEIKVQKPLHERSSKCVFVAITALMVSTRKWFFSSAHREYVIENTLSVAALVPGMAKEDSKISYVFFNDVHSLRINSNISDHVSKVVSDFVFHSTILVSLMFAICTNSYDT